MAEPNYGREYREALRKHWVRAVVTGGAPAGVGIGLVIAYASLVLPWWGWLNLAGLGVFVAQWRAWKDVAMQRDKVMTERDALLAEKAAPKSARQ